MTDVLIIRAGIAGRTAAVHLEHAGLSVRIVDKGRGGTGRCATRRTELFSCDHGAQYFTIREPQHIPWIARAIEAGQVAEWHPRLGVSDGQRVTKNQSSTETRRYVATPGMSSLGRVFDQELKTKVEFSVCAESIKRNQCGSATTVVSEDPEKGQYAAAWILSTTPPPQSAALLQEVAPGLASQCRTFEAVPTWTGAFALPKPIDLDFDAIFINSGALAGGFAARNSSKPGRKMGLDIQDVWVVHAGARYSEDHLEFSSRDMEQRLWQEMLRARGVSASHPCESFAHRWRYARPRQDAAHHAGCLIEESTNVVWAGDWLRGGRVEGAMLSGKSAADAIISRFKQAAK